MSQNYWKWSKFSLTFNCVSFMYVWVVALVLVANVEGNSTPSRLCKSKPADLHPCLKTEHGISNNAEESKLSSSSTTNLPQRIYRRHADSEVADLNKHNSNFTVKPVGYTSANKTGNKGDKESDTPKDSEIIDTIVKPNYASSKNTRFNITAGGIIILLCMTVTIIFYAGIMLWKKMNGYDNREILLNDDDIADINDEDMRHFELKFLDKDGRVIESTNRSLHVSR